MSYWLEDIDSEGRISRATRNLYERTMRTLVSPAFHHPALREISVARDSPTQPMDHIARGHREPHVRMRSPLPR
ncbi:MAG: hypothetical protein ABWX56_08320 [Mycetocola sp.]